MFSLTRKCKVSFFLYVPFRHLSFSTSEIIDLRRKMDKDMDKPTKKQAWIIKITKDSQKISYIMLCVFPVLFFFLLTLVLTNTASSHKHDSWILGNMRSDGAAGVPRGCQKPFECSQLNSQSSAFRAYTCARPRSLSCAAFWTAICRGRAHDKRLTGSQSSQHE